MVRTIQRFYDASSLDRKALPRTSETRHERSNNMPIQEHTMIARTTLAAIVTAVAALTVLPGCSVTRGQSSVGEYIDDSAITTQVKAKFVESKSVDAAAIKVETLEGTVMLSGFAKDANEKVAAESLARDVKGVKSVKNQLVIR
jgi:osmotically-inducible protein OsmY